MALYGYVLVDVVTRENRLCRKRFMGLTGAFSSASLFWPVRTTSCWSIDAIFTDPANIEFDGTAVIQSTIVRE